MAKPSFRSQALKGTLIAHSIISIIVGVILLARATMFAKTVGWEPLFDPVMTHVVGAALVTWGIASLFTYPDPLKNAVVVRLEIIFGILACGAVLFSLLFRADLTPDFAWVLVGLTGFFALLLLILYPTE